MFLSSSCIKWYATWLPQVRSRSPPNLIPDNKPSPPSLITKKWIFAFRFSSFQWGRGRNISYCILQTIISVLVFKSRLKPVQKANYRRKRDLVIFGSEPDLRGQTTLEFGSFTCTQRSVSLPMRRSGKPRVGLQSLTSCWHLPLRPRWQRLETLFARLNKEINRKTSQKKIISLHNESDIISTK